MNLEGIGRLLLTVGVGVLALGGVLYLLGKLGVGRLPGDLVFRGKNVTVFIPIGLSILISIVGTVILNLLYRR